MSFLSQLHEKTVLVLGLGVSGLSCARFLHAQGIEFAVNDSRTVVSGIEQIKQLNDKLTITLGKWDKQLITKADVIIVSPGIDLENDALAPLLALNPDALIIGDVELFCRISNIPTLAVTGSNGKSTVVSLLTHVAKKLGFKAEMAGNIGVPVLDLYGQELDCLILELSSFQLETINHLKAVASTVLNVSDDHLDRHKTMANYRAIKQRIHLNSKVAVINRQDQTLPLVMDDKTIVSFGCDNPNENEFGIVSNGETSYLALGNKSLIEVNKLPIKGLHNATNCLAVLAMGQAMGWSIDLMVEALCDFNGLPHRCQLVASSDGIVWINDSKATNIGATLAAIQGIKTPQHKLILIAGGQGKGADFTEMQQVMNTDVDVLITLGIDGEQLAVLKDDTIRVNSLTEAVFVAQKQAKVGDVVLLSPACASLDMFDNFAHRGMAFINAVQNLQDNAGGSDV